MAQRRILKELRDASTNHTNDFSIRLIDNDLFHCEGNFIGEIGTPYENGSFYVDIKFPYNYPLSPPKVNFKTKIYHPNILDYGHLELEILCPRGWKVSNTISDALLCIKSMLKEPDTNDSINHEVSYQFKNDYEKFFRTAREWTELYAV